MLLFRLVGQIMPGRIAGFEGKYAVRCQMTLDTCQEAFLVSAPQESLESIPRDVDEGKLV